MPAHVRDGAFGKWLEGAHDGRFPRNRFWGAPVPVWKSDDPRYPRIDVYGSLDELEADFGVRPANLHRPAIDELVRANPDDPSGKSVMRRVEDVLDCWFESGSMPFAQVHYPFENADWFEGHFPADFIVEYVGQTRGWFYTLHVLASALFGRPPFKTCMAHGVVLGDDRQKLSKRFAITPTPTRCSVFTGQTPCAGSFSRHRSYVEETWSSRGARAEAVRSVLNPLWNAWKFFALYADADGYQAKWRSDAARCLTGTSWPKLGCWSKRLVTRWTPTTSTGRVWPYRVFSTPSITGISGAAGTASGAALAPAAPPTKARRTLTTPSTPCSTRCASVSAPLLSLVTETVYRGLTGERSVHLADWPSPSTLPEDDDLASHMDTVSEAVCSAGHSVRKAGDLRARLPLSCGRWWRGRGP